MPIPHNAKIFNRDIAVTGLYISDNSTATATSGAATLNATAGVVTSEALTTAAASNYTLTLTNSKATASSIVLWSVNNGTNTTEGLSPLRVTPAAGSIVFVVRNAHASSALNGTIKVSYVLMPV